MDFNEFHKKMYSVLGQGAPQGVFAKTLFEYIINEKDTDILDMYKRDTYSRYANGRNDISKLAKKISAKIEPMNFENWLEDQNDSIIQGLCEEFIEDIPDITLHDCPQKLSECFCTIIRSAASKTRTVHNQPQTNLLVENKQVKKSDLKSEFQIRMTNYQFVGETKDKSLISTYLQNAKKKHSKKNTFLYETERDFYSFYVCNDVNIIVDSPIDIFYESDYIEYSDDSNGERGTIRDFCVSKIPLPITRVLLLGTGGLGKSMMMTHLFLNAIDEYNGDRVPIFITIRNYEFETNPLFDFIYSEFSRHNANIQIDDYKNLLLDGSLILLIDGFDEVKHSQLENLERELDLFIDQYPDNLYIISSRPGAKTGVLSRFQTFELNRFSQDQAIEMVRKLDENTVSNEIKEDFIADILNNSFGLNKSEKNNFLGIPLFLSIMLLTYENNHDIPRQRFLFYNDAYDAMARKHDAKKSLRREFRTGLDHYTFKRFLGQFCALSYYDETYSFDRDEIEILVNHLIEKNGYSFTVDDFIEDMTRKICILYKEGDDSFFFVHRSFQEYFAAFFFSEQSEEYFSNIYDMFRSRDELTYEDNTLEMLYGLAPQKTELKIFIPFLKEVTSSHSSDVDGFWTFLSIVIEQISYTTNNILYKPFFALNSRIFSAMIIIYKLKLPEWIFKEMYPYFPEIVDEEIVVYNSEWRNTKSEAKNENILKRRVPSDYPDYDNLQIVGYACSMLFEEIRLDPSLYNDVISYIESDESVMKKSYNEAVRLLHNLEEKYKKKKPVMFADSFNFIDSFPE